MYRAIQNKIKASALLLIITVLVLGVLLTITAQHAYAEDTDYTNITLKHVYNPDNIKRLTESEMQLSLSHKQIELGKEEWEYVAFHIDEISWVGFEKVYRSDYDAAGGVRSTNIDLYKNRDRTDRVNKHPMVFKALLMPGTYYAAISCFGSYDYYGWYMPCKDVIETAEMVYLGENESYLRIKCPESTRAPRYYVSELPENSVNVNFASPYITSRVCTAAELGYKDGEEQFKYKSNNYDISTGNLLHLSIDPKNEYYAHVYYTNLSPGVDDQWTTWNFFVPIKIKDISKKLPKGYMFEDEQGVQYTVISSEKGSRKVKVTGCVNDYSSIKIPACVSKNGVKYKVIEIEDKAFSGLHIKEVTIGSNVQRIGVSAFSNCEILKTVKLGKNVKTICKKAFYNCKSLGSLTIPANVKTIGKSAFQKCSDLLDIRIKSKLLKSKNIGSKAFKDTSKYASVYLPKSKFKTYRKMLKSKGISSNANFWKL